MALTPTQQQFLTQIAPYAGEQAKRLGISPVTIASQAALESGWGQHAPGGNYFGIKGAGGTAQTKEFRNGQWDTENASFRQYPSLADSVKGYGDFIAANKRYTPVLQSGNDYNANIDALARAGYATDPNYANKVKSIASQINGANVFTNGGNAPKEELAAASGSQSSFPLSRASQPSLMGFGLNGSSASSSVPQGFGIAGSGRGYSPLSSTLPASFMGGEPDASQQVQQQQPQTITDEFYNTSPAPEDYGAEERNATIQKNAQQEAQNGIGAIPAVSIPAIG